MNNVFLIGKIISEIEYKFIYDRYKFNENHEKYKHVVIATCKIELLNKSIVKIYEYDNIADYMYRNLKVNDNLLIEGKLNSLGNIEIICLNYWFLL